MSKRWEPEYGETYYYFWTTGYTAGAVWTNTTSDKNLFERGNCFETKEEAESASKKHMNFWLLERQGNSRRYKHVA